MSETKKALLGKTISRKVISWLLVCAMIIGLAPADLALVAQAAAPTVKVYFEKPADWTTPVINVWDSSATVTGGENAAISQWGDQEKPTLINDDATGLYYVEVASSNWTGFQFVDAGSEAASAPEMKVDDAAVLKAFNAFTGDTSVYYLADSEGTYAWYTDAAGTTKLELPSVATVYATLHFLNSDNWTAPCINAWNGIEYTGVGEDTPITGWNGGTAKAMTAAGENYYTATIKAEGEVAGIQFVDAETGTVNALSADALALINACTAEAATDVYYGNGIISTNKDDIEKPVIVTSEVPVTRESPIYHADGVVEFNLAKQATKAILKGVFTSWDENPIKMTPVTESEDGFVGFTATAEVPTEGGLYEYGMTSGEENNWEGDPENKTVKGNPVVVRNPEIGNGTVTIYQPFVGTSLDGKVLYRKAGTTDAYAEKAFEAVEGAKNLFAAVISDAEANVKYEYQVQIGTAAAAYDKYNFASQEVSNGKIITTFTATAAVNEPEHTSPVINADGTVTFNYWAPSATAVYVAGDMNGWAPGKDALIKDEETGLFSLTVKIPAGTYGYKFVVDSDWILDPKNPKTNDGGNSLLVVPVSEEGVKSPIVDADNGTITFNFDPKDYGIEPAGLTGVNLMGTVPGTNWDAGLEMTLTEDGYYTITVKDIQPGRYQYKFKTSGGSWLTDAKNAETESGNSLVIMPGMMITGTNAAGAGQFQYKADGIADEGSIKFSMEEPVAGFSITEDGLLSVSSDAKTGYFTLGLDYKEEGVAKHTTAKFYYTERAAIYEYEYKEGSEYTGISDIYTWNNAASVTSYNFEKKGDKYIAYINADEATTAFGYIVRLFGKWGADENTDREFKDRTFTLHDGERYTKVRGGEGIEVPYVLASAKTYYDNGIIFNYRDDDKFYNGTMDTIKSAKVVINGKEYDMEYNAKDELFTYAFQNIEDGDYEYYFLIDGQKVEDQYNTSGKLHYEKPELEIDATVTPEEANYDQNPVVTLNVTNKETGEKVALNSIEADITAIAGKEMKAQFSTITNKGVLYIDRSVAKGSYEIPITIKDKYGNATETKVTVKVTDKTTTDASWDEARIYFMVTDRFADGNKSNNGTKGYDPEKIEAYHGGDFAGVTSKLGYLQELGINTIWITPIVDNIEDVMNEELTQTAYHGYWAKDFTKLDEHLGTTEELDKLLDEAHKRGIKVMVDIVVNHAGYNTNDSENFKGMLRTKDELGSDFITSELSDLPDFKTEIQEVRAKLIAWQTAWANHTTAAGNSIDYFRVDTVKHVEHETWQQLKTSLAEVNPNFKMIGEFYGASITNTGDYLGNGQMDSELDFDFKSVARNFVNGNIDSVEKALETRNTALTNNLTMGQFLSSHDEDGFLYSIGYDLNKAKVAAALQMTAKGQPVIYYGEEIGLSGPNAFGKQDNNRYDMQFDNLTDDQEAMLSHYKKLLAARAMYSETFATGTRTKVAGSDNDGYVVFKRSTADEEVYVALNTTDEEKTVTVNLTGNVTPETPFNKKMTDVYSGKAVDVVNGTMEITIPASSEGGTAIIAEAKELTGIEVAAPTKTDYIVGEALDLTNLTVTGVYGTEKAALQKDEYTVDSSEFDSSKEGTYTITVKAYGFTKTFTVTVSAKPVTPDVPTEIPTATPTTVPTKTPTKTPTIAPTKVPTVTPYVKAKSIKLDAKKITLGKKASITLTATVNPTNAKYKKVTWSSSNPKVATVSKTGKVTAKAAGKATITATVKDGVKATCKITVSSKPSYKVTYKLARGKNHGLNPTYIAKGQTIKLKAPVRKGYAFKGWYVNGKKVTKIKGSKKVTVTAKWEKVKVSTAKLNSAKNVSSKKIAVKYSKVKGAAGYEVSYSTSKRFTKSTTKTVISKKTSTTIKGLSKGKTYYVKVRAFKKDSAGKAVYGKSSKVIKVKVAK